MRTKSGSRRWVDGLLLCVFISVWGVSFGLTVWRGVEGDHPAFDLFVTSASDANGYPQVVVDVSPQPELRAGDKRRR